MGGVWCKTEREPSRSYSPKNHFNATITRWTDHVRQAYRKPKTYHRPPRPPQKPLRSHGRLTISHPQLVREESSNGWRTATLMVPEAAPVPPPRKKRKRNQDLTRTAYSMDDLNRVRSLNNSTISLPDKYPPETGFDSRSSSSTLVVTPVLEARFDHLIEEADDKLNDDKENMKTNVNDKIEEEEEEGRDEVDAEVADHADEIIPIEKETLFSSRTLLQSNLGYIDKLSAISEVSAESGFDDRLDIGKCSERSESVTSAESVSREPGLNILAHIQNINNVSQLNEANIKEKTAISKKEWLQNILKEEPEPYFISRDTIKGSRRGSDSMALGEKAADNSEQPNSLPTDHLHLMNRETETSAADFIASKTPPPSPDQKTNPSTTYDATGTNHSVLLELLQKNNLPEDKSVPLNPFIHKEESIFLTNTKTNIIYKSLSSDKLTDDYEIGCLGTLNETELSQPDITLNKSKEDVSKSTSTSDRNCALDSTNPFNDVTPHSHLSDYSFQTPKLVESDPGLNSLFEDKRSNVVSSFDFKEITKSQNYVTALKDLQLSGVKTSTESQPGNLVNGVDSNSMESGTETIKNVESGGMKDNDKKLNLKEHLTARDSVSSSRRSSITDSLHEFEMSIYDMLKESKKYRDSSEDEDSLKPVKTEKRQ